MTLCLHDNDTDMCSILNKRSNAATGKFIRTLKKDIWEHMTVVSKKICTLIKYDKQLTNKTTYIIQELNQNLSMLKRAPILSMVLTFMTKIVNLMLVNMWEYQKTHV